MGFNRRKMEDQRRTAAEREAASRRKAQDAPGWPLLFITQLEIRTASAVDNAERRLKVSDGRKCRALLYLLKNPVAT